MPATSGSGPSNSPNAFVTLLTSDSYLPGALVLASSLRATITRHPLLCLVPTNALSSGAMAALRQAYDRVIDVPLLRSASTQNLHLLGRTDLDITFTKLHVFNPDVTGCDKVVFMDADVMVTRNVDALFEYLQGDVVFAAAPDIGWPDCFNSGVFACRPSRDVFDSLVNMATTVGSFDGGDQGVLNSFFSSWATGVPRPGSSFHRTGRLPFTYNVTPTSFYSYLPALKHFYNDISVVHFIGQDKPWKMPRTGGEGGASDAEKMGGGGGPMQEFVRRWWQFYDAVKHVYDQSVAGKNAGGFARQYNNWTGTAPHHRGHHHQSSGPSHSQGHQPSDTVTDFSNYRISWDTRESSPLRTTFSITSTPFAPTYRAFQDDPDPVFHESEEPKALFPDQSIGDAVGLDISPVSSESSKRRPSYQDFEMQVDKAQAQRRPSVQQNLDEKPLDLGNYRVGWNPVELGKRSILLEAPSSTFSSPNKWQTSSTDLSTTAPAMYQQSHHDDEDDDHDDRVWNEDEDEEAFVARLRSGRVRSASGGSGSMKSPASPLVFAPAHGDLA